ncbi:MAG TPA: F0F1 ATP synthase subunit alpha [Eubacteriaceae bacterium]|nr:F0F1 ATP synthase subunit alpha [Eubacteriaceae bacterium]
MLKNQLDLFDEFIEQALIEDIDGNYIEESGTVHSIDRGIAIVKGLKAVRSQELIQFPMKAMGMAFNLDHDSVGVIMLGEYSHIKAGDRVKRTYKVADIPVGEEYIGRAISPLGVILDNKGKVEYKKRMPIEREAPAIMARDPVNKPLQTGIKVIDAIVPIGKGQRELILGDRQTGKTALAIDAIINQKNKNVICIYCAIGQQISSISKIIDVLEKKDAMSYSIIMIAESDDPPGVAFIAPYAAAAMAEYFMEKGADVLVVYDDLTKHARAYRELSLLLERPPGREAYPGDIFYIHSRLLERSTQLKKEYGGGSFTAIPIIETQAENISAYIPTNLISITDGQIYVSPKLFRKGNIPAINIGSSVSRVGGKTQLVSYRNITSALKLTYSQFEEMEIFASFAARLDEKTRSTINRGMRIRKAFNQQQFTPMEVDEQIGVFLALTEGLLDDVSIEEIGDAEKIIQSVVREHEEFAKEVSMNNSVGDEVKKDFLKMVKNRLEKELK